MTDKDQAETRRIVNRRTVLKAAGMMLMASLPVGCKPPEQQSPPISTDSAATTPIQTGQPPTATFSQTPTAAIEAVPTIDAPIVAISAGGDHSLVLLENGEVWGWGLNNGGQLGNGVKTDSPIPIQIAGLPKIGSISAAESYFSLAIDLSGVVWSWGADTRGESSFPADEDRGIPQAIANLKSVRFIAASVSHSLAVKDDGTVWGWARNRNGYIFPNVGADEITELIQIEGLSDVITVATGGVFSLAVRTDGSVIAWGENTYGELGIGNRETQNSPVQVIGLNDAVGVAVAFRGAFALRRNGDVWRWGGNNKGGDGASIELVLDPIPYAMPGLSNIIQIDGSESCFYALKNDGTVWAMGSNESGQLGNGSVEKGVATNEPSQVMNLENVVSVSAGWQHGLALTKDGSVWGWGANDSHQLGVIDSNPQPIPIRII